VPRQTGRRGRLPDGRNIGPITHLSRIIRSRGPMATTPARNPTTVGAAGCRQHGAIGTAISHPTLWASGQRKPSSSSFAQAIVWSMVFPVRTRATMPGMTARFHICTAISGGAEEPVI